MGFVSARQGLEYAKRKDTPGIDMAYHLAGLLGGVGLGIYLLATARRRLVKMYHCKHELRHYEWDYTPDGPVSKERCIFCGHLVDTLKPYAELGQTWYFHTDTPSHSKTWQGYLVWKRERELMGVTDA